MKTVNSLSGGKTSSYLAKHFPADIEIFALVRVEDTDCLWMKGKDEKTRQLVSDRIGKEFIGTVEMDMIIYTMLDLEQYLGREIQWVTGETFEKIIENHGGYLPNKIARFCTTEMKILPIFNYLRENTTFPVEMRIGYRPNETTRIQSIKDRADENGLEYFKAVVGKHKNGNNKWNEIPYRYAKFPLAENNIPKDTIYDFWKDKPVRFAYRNNCMGCVNRQPLMIANMAHRELNKVEWFKKQEEKTGNQFLTDISFSKILKLGKQGSLFNDDDFSDCDAGYCEP